MRIVDLTSTGTTTDEFVIDGAAEVLLSAFAGRPFAWSSKGAALTEVRESLLPGHISLVALSDDDSPVGWVAAIAGYEGATWELHPLAVSPAWQGSGVGSALLNALEARVRERGGRNLWLTTDDSTGGTNLFGIDLYPEVLQRLMELHAGNHPIGFYRRHEFVVTGVIPDAYGPGRHDIVMAKRLR